MSSAVVELEFTPKGRNNTSATSHCWVDGGLFGLQRCVVCENHIVNLDEPRPLSKPERLILEALLTLDFPGVAELRAQISRVQVVGACDCGCPTIDLEVPMDVAASPVETRARLAPVEGRVIPLAAEPPGEIILFVDGGRLSCLEYVSYDDPSPSEWPSLDRVTLVCND